MYVYEDYTGHWLVQCDSCGASILKTNSRKSAILNWNEVGHRISRKKAQAIWDYAYEKGHAFGFTSIQSELSDIIDLADTLLNTRTRNS